MDYKWARDFALELINQYSVAGTEVPDTYNNQADYVKRIPKLLDDAQMRAATTTAKIRSVVPLSSLSCTEAGEWLIYTLPRNCWQLCSGGLIRMDGPRFQRFHKYHPVGKNQLAVHRDVDGEMSVEYYRYPRPLGPDPDESDLLDNDPEVQMALPYYVAAYLVMHDNAFAFSALSNEFESRLVQLAEVPQTDVHSVEDSYSAAEWDHNY